ncbi:MAG: hypothetical protein U9O94_04635 [Nanoarchaeota archaeon]|nr:hypothetical protein [Nanoarchaeota archaeon]
MEKQESDGNPIWISNFRELAMTMINSARVIHTPTNAVIGEWSGDDVLYTPYFICGPLDIPGLTYNPALFSGREPVFYRSRAESLERSVRHGNIGGDIDIFNISSWEEYASFITGGSLDGINTFNHPAGMYGKIVKISPVEALRDGEVVYEPDESIQHLGGDAKSIVYTCFDLLPGMITIGADYDKALWEKKNQEVRDLIERGKQIFFRTEQEARMYEMTKNGNQIDGRRMDVSYSIGPRDTHFEVI